MQWSDVLQDPTLQDLPYKIELNEWGQIVMTPASNWHGRCQSKMVGVLERCLVGGEVIVECSIETDAGVKVADVAWCSSVFIQKHSFDTPFTAAPEICIEVVSPTNSEPQMQAKMALYIQRGAEECWLVSESGQVRFFDRDGERARSRWGIDLSLLT